MSDRLLYHQALLTIADNYRRGLLTDTEYVEQVELVSLTYLS